jgi:hypothetical protein
VNVRHQGTRALVVEELDLRAAGTVHLRCGSKRGGRHPVNCGQGRAFF